jgi:isopentenyl-diphosphate delta-isomerase
VAKAVALGAAAGGLAAPVLKAHRAGGVDGARNFLRSVITTVRSLMLLTGSRTVAELQRAPMILGPDLARWTP